LQLYMHEWSAKLPLAIGSDGLFTYPHAGNYVDDEHEAVLFLDDDRLVGFALVRRIENDAWQVQEMFVLASERRRGAGLAAFEALTARHPGPWTLTVRRENPEALAFWRRAIADAPEQEHGSDGVLRWRFRFVR
jgi:predicted acetyltransferase